MSIFLRLQLETELAGFGSFLWLVNIWISGEKGLPGLCYVQTAYFEGEVDELSHDELVRLSQQFCISPFASFPTS